MLTNPYKKYHNTNISTADNKKIIILLYEGAIKFLNLAIQSIEKKDPDSRVLYVNKTLAIILYLSNCLDFEKGGEIADNLSRLYDFIRDNTTAGSIESNTDKLKVSIDLFKTLLEGWQGIIDQPIKQENATATPSPVEYTSEKITELFAQAT